MRIWSAERSLPGRLLAATILTTIPIVASRHSHPAIGPLHNLAISAQNFLHGGVCCRIRAAMGRGAARFTNSPARRARTASKPPKAHTTSGLAGRSGWSDRGPAAACFWTSSAKPCAAGLAGPPRLCGPGRLAGRGRRAALLRAL